MSKRTQNPDWRGFALEICGEWPVDGIDGDVVFDAALKYGLIREIPGGYDPDRDTDAYGIAPDRGDPWFEWVSK